MQSTDKETIHQGRNVKRFREMLGIKQEALAFELGEDWNQQKVSVLEQKEIIEDGLLEQISKLLKVPVEAIKNFDEDKAINVIGNTYQDNATSNVNYHCNFNPLDKMLETVEENKKLYERLLASEKEKVELLQRVLEERR